MFWFIDEIHRLNRSVEEVLYQAMEDYKLDILIGQGPGARTVKIDPLSIYIGWCHHSNWIVNIAPARSFWCGRETFILRNLRIGANRGTLGKDSRN